MSDKYYQFQAVIHTVHDKGGAYIEFPYDIRKEFKKRQSQGTCDL